MTSGRAHTVATALGIQQAHYRHGPVRFEGDDPGANFTAELQLEGFGPYRYDGRLPIRRREGTWRVRWTPAVLHPLLTGGRRFERTRRFAPVSSASVCTTTAPCRTRRTSLGCTTA